MKKLSIVLPLLLAFVLAACNRETSESTPNAQIPIKADFPSLTFEEIVGLNANEFSELERRCLGVQNQTCKELKGAAVKASRSLQDLGNLIKKGS